MAFRRGPPLVWDDPSGDLHYLKDDGSTEAVGGGGGGTGTPSATVVTETAFGQSAAAGGATSYARGDHTHGTPIDPVTAHIAAGDPHPGYALDADMSAHVAAADPHPAYALDSDLSAHAAAADPHAGYQLESQSTADHLTDATVTGKAAIRATDEAALTALLNLATAALKGLVPAPGASTGRFLRDDLTYAVPAGGGGGASATTVEVNLGSLAFQGKFTITDAAISATSKVLCWQAPGPYTGKGTLPGEEVLAPIVVTSAVAAAGSAAITWQTPPTYTNEVLPASGRLDSSAVNVHAKESQTVRRKGLFSGNCKFSYVVFS
jgi:hypothetical protein